MDLPIPHPLIISSYLNPSCRHMNTPGPLLEHRDIWTKIGPGICYLNIAVHGMPCPMFVSKFATHEQVYTWLPATQILPWEFSMNSSKLSSLWI